jgi:P4 family phage/plasmid primase-like protien
MTFPDYFNNHSNFCGFSFQGITTQLNKQGVEKKKIINMTNWKQINRENYKQFINPNHKGFAIITGKLSGITVFDFDDRDVYNQLVKEHPELTSCFTVETKNGFHIYFEYDKEIKTTTNGMTELAGIDIRNDDSIVFCPPTSYKKLNGETFEYEFKGGKIIQVPEYLKSGLKQFEMEGDETDEENEEVTKSNSVSSCEVLPSPLLDLNRKKELTKNYSQIDLWLENGDLNFLANSDSWDDWRDVMFCLKHTDDSVQMYEKFNTFSQINQTKYNPQDTLKLWTGAKIRKIKPLTIATLFKKIKDNKIKEKRANGQEFIHDQELIQLEGGFEEYQVATYLYKHYCFRPEETHFRKENQIIVSTGIKGKCQMWFSFNNGKWNGEKDGIIMREIISNEFHNKLIAYMDEFKSVDPEPDKEIIDKMTNLAKHCRKNVFKNTVMSELYDICKINDFEEKLDLNPNLLCCRNGIIDLKKKEFRPAAPNDMCSLSTNIDYDENLDDCVIASEIATFFEQLFPQESQRTYMLEHLASVLFGTTKNQSFNYYLGGGSNGKSLLIELMTEVLGDYKGTVPLPLVTQKRASIGGTSSEIVQLRGRRYAVIQEPKKGETLNDGVMKELTGGDPLTARALYKEAITFKPMFTLAICANIKMNINSNDHGVWRRIKLIEFGSKFVDHQRDVCEEDYTFLKNKNLCEKFNSWKKYLLRILVQIAFDKQGMVSDSVAVAAATERYRLSQDKIGQFIAEMIVPDTEKPVYVVKTVLSKVFKEWFESNYKYSIKSKELFDRLDEEYDSNAQKYVGFNLKDGYNEENEKEELIDRETMFQREFLEAFSITRDQNDFIPRTDIVEWSKEKGLAVKTSAAINNILKNRLKIDKDDNTQCRRKKINGTPVWCWFGVKKLP